MIRKKNSTAVRYARKYFIVVAWIIPVRCTFFTFISAFRAIFFVFVAVTCRWFFFACKFYLMNGTKSPNNDTEYFFLMADRFFRMLFLSTNTFPLYVRMFLTRMHSGVKDGIGKDVSREKLSGSTFTPATLKGIRLRDWEKQMTILYCSIEYSGNTFRAQRRSIASIAIPIEWAKQST